MKLKDRNKNPTLYDVARPFIPVPTYGENFEMADYPQLTLALLCSLDDGRLDGDDFEHNCSAAAKIPPDNALKLRPAVLSDYGMRGCDRICIAAFMQLLKMPTLH